VGVARHAGGTDGIQGFSRLDAYLRALNPERVSQLYQRFVEYFRGLRLRAR